MRKIIWPRLPKWDALPEYFSARTPEYEYSDVDQVLVFRERWRRYIVITLKNDPTHPIILVADADSYYTELDRIWFGTLEEHLDFDE